MRMNINPENMKSEDELTPEQEANLDRYMEAARVGLEALTNKLDPENTGSVSGNAVWRTVAIAVTKLLLCTAEQEGVDVAQHCAQKLKEAVDMATQQLEMLKLLESIAGKPITTEGEGS